MNMASPSNHSSIHFSQQESQEDSMVNNNNFKIDSIKPIRRDSNELYTNSIWNFGGNGVSERLGLGGLAGQFYDNNSNNLLNMNGENSSNGINNLANLAIVNPIGISRPSNAHDNISNNNNGNRKVRNNSTSSNGSLSNMNLPLASVNPSNNSSNTGFNSFHQINQQQLPIASSNLAINCNHLATSNSNMPISNSNNSISTDFGSYNSNKKNEFQFGPLSSISPLSRWGIDESIWEQRATNNGITTTPISSANMEGKKNNNINFGHSNGMYGQQPSLNTNMNSNDSATALSSTATLTTSIDSFSASGANHSRKNQIPSRGQHHRLYFPSNQLSYHLQHPHHASSSAIDQASTMPSSNGISLDGFNSYHHLFASDQFSFGSINPISMPTSSANSLSAHHTFSQSQHQQPQFQSHQQTLSNYQQQSIHHPSVQTQSMWSIGPSLSSSTTFQPSFNLDSTSYPQSQPYLGSSNPLSSTKHIHTSSSCKLSSHQNYVNSVPKDFSLNNRSREIPNSWNSSNASSYSNLVYPTANLSSSIHQALFSSSCATSFNQTTGNNSGRTPGTLNQLLGLNMKTKFIIPANVVANVSPTSKEPVFSENPNVKRQEAKSQTPTSAHTTTTPNTKPTASIHTSQSTSTTNSTKNANTNNMMPLKKSYTGKVKIIKDPATLDMFKTCTVCQLERHVEQISKEVSDSITCKRCYALSQKKATSTSSLASPVAAISPTACLPPTAPLSNMRRKVVDVHYYD